MIPSTGQFTHTGTLPRNKKINPLMVKAIYSYYLEHWKDETIAKFLMIEVSDVVAVVEGKRFKDFRNKYPRLEELKTEIKRRKKYFKKKRSKYILNKIEKMWLSGMGREKIKKETGYGDVFLKRVISDLVKKHDRPRADWRLIDDSEG